MCKTVNWIVSNIQSIITIGSVLLAVFLWFATMSNIPVQVRLLETRVDKVETKVSEIEKSLEKNNTKTDLILQAVYDLRNNAMRRQ